jgi:hypothetical protein
MVDFMMAIRGSETFDFSADGETKTTTPLERFKAIAKGIKPTVNTKEHDFSQGDDESSNRLVADIGVGMKK